MEGVGEKDNFAVESGESHGNSGESTGREEEGDKVGEEEGTTSHLEQKEKLTDEGLAEMTGIFRKWLRHQPHLPQQLDDRTLRIFIEGCKGNLERASTKLDAYYTARTTKVKFYINRDPKGEDIEKTNAWSRIFPVLDQDGSWVIFLSYNGMDPDPANLNESFLGYFRKLLMVVDLTLRSMEVNRGYYIVADKKNERLSYYLAVSPILVKDVVRCMVDVLPLRLKGVVFINTPWIFEVAMNNLVKPILSKKIFERLHFYSDGPEVLLNHFSKEILPREYGGLRKSLDEMDGEFREELVKNREWFLSEGSWHSDENLRPIEPKKKGSMCSVM